MRHQQSRFLRGDAHRFVPPDGTRYLLPRVDPADVHPALAMKRRREKEAARRVEARQLAAEIAELKAMRDDLLAIKAVIARCCEATIHARKYSPSQPRDYHGRWTRGNGGQPTGSSGGGEGEGERGGDSGEALGFAEPMGNIDFGDLTGWSESEGLFNIAPGGSWLHAASGIKRAKKLISIPNLL